MSYGRYGRPGARGKGGDGAVQRRRVAPGKRTLTEGLQSRPRADGAGASLGSVGLQRAMRNNPIYHAQLRYDPAVFGAGNDVRTEDFALAVARYQQGHGLRVDGMAGPITVGHVRGEPQPDRGNAPADDPTPEPRPEPTLPPPRTEQTEYGTFIVYPDSFVGPLPPSGPHGEHVHEGEYQRILAQRQAAAVAAREQAVSQIDDLLSYGAFDWAITDGEATEALNLLAALPMSQLQVAVGRIDAQRLLDNLPSGSRRTPAFARVIIAMGPARYRPFIHELLSYDVLDWAIRDAEVQVVIDILTALPGPQRLILLRSLAPTQLSRLARNLGRDVQAANDLLKAIFDVTPDADLSAMESTFERRFNVDLSTWFLRRWQMSIKEKWDAAGLRRLWTIFEQLPPGHIEDNDRLEMFLRESTTDGSGVYYGGPQAGVVSYGDVNARGGYGAIMVPDGAGGQRDVGLNTNVNLFSTVVRHEVGHSVDAKIGASAEGGYTSTAASAGQWRTYGSSDAFVDAMVSAGGGMSGHGYPNEEVYRRAMRRAVSEDEDFAAALREVDPRVAAPAAAVTGPVAAVFDKSRWHPDSSPWYDNPDRQDVGGRLWQRPYGSGEYVSFVKTARTSHGVSAYQFRAPGEWFAEAYAVYYSDRDGPAGNPVGTRLRTRDTATADWFDANVDKGHSLQRETGQGGGAGGGGAGDGGAGGGAGTVARAPAGGTGPGAGGGG